MLKVGSSLLIGDNTGVLEIKSIGKLGKSKFNYLYIGDIVVGTVIRSSNTNYPRSTILKALVVNTKKLFRRKNGSILFFPQNIGIVVDFINNTIELEPKASTINCFVPYEIKKKYKKIGLISQNII